MTQGEKNKKYKLVIKLKYNQDENYQYEVLNQTISADYEKPTIKVVAKKYTSFKSKKLDTYSDYESDSWTNKNVYVKATVNSCNKTTTIKLLDGSESKKITTEGQHALTFKTEYGNNNTPLERNLTVKIDKTPPTCNVTGGSSTWINKKSSTTSRTITATCEDEEGGSGCKTESFSKVYSTDMNITTAGANGDNNGGTVEDNAGNQTNCAANQTVKIDKTPPTCTSSGGSSNWTKSAVTLTGTCNDGTSQSKSGCVANNVTKTITKDTNGNVSPGTVSDKAGNSVTCPNQKVKIDNTPPTAPTVVLKKWADNDTAPTSSNYTSLRAYSNNTWSKRNVYTRATSSTDSGSGGIKYYYTTTGKTTNSTDANSAHRNIAAEGTSKIKYKACDALNNCSNYSSTYTIKIDKTAPDFTLVKTELSSSCKSTGCLYAVCLQVKKDTSLTKGNLQDVNSSCPDKTTYTGYDAGFTYYYPGTSSKYGSFADIGVYLGYRGYGGEYDSCTKIRVCDRADNCKTKEFQIKTNSNHTIKSIEDGCD